MVTARKLFRLFKSLIEYGTMKKLMTDPIKNALPILARMAFFSYWFFDNIVILIKIKVIQGWDLKLMARRAAKSWLTGTIIGLIIAQINLAEASKEANQLIAQKSKKENSEVTTHDQQFQTEMARLKATRKT